MNKVVYAEENLIPVYQQAYALCYKHWLETECKYRNAAYDPNYEQLVAYEQQGFARYFTARLDGEIIGHIYFMVFDHLHTQKKTANEDFFYFLPEHRKGSSAIRLLKYAVKSLKDEGCVTVGVSSKLTGKKNINKLLERMDFQHVANFYVI